MKWLIYFLVVVNVAFFVWQYRRGGEPTTTPAAGDLASGPRLLLRGEASEHSLYPRNPLSPPPSESRPGAQAAAAKTDEPEAPVAKSVSARSDSPKAVAGGLAQTCLTMGPFSADQAAEDLIVWLKGNGGEVTSRWSEQQTPNRYWVYLPPLETVEQARVVLRRLKDDGLQDYVRVMRGPMRNAISLGLFSQRGSADRRLVELRAKGYDPELDIRYKSERVRWLDVAFAGEGRFSEATFRSEFPSVSWTPAHCPAAGPIAGAPNPG